MSEYPETEESTVSDENQQGEAIVNAVSEAISDWVVDESIAVERQGSDIVADEEELVQNISIMVAIAVDEAAE